MSRRFVRVFVLAVGPGCRHDTGVTISVGQRGTNLRKAWRDGCRSERRDRPEDSDLLALPIINIQAAAGCPRSTGIVHTVRILALLSSARMSFCMASVRSCLSDSIALEQEQHPFTLIADTHFRSSQSEKQARPVFFSQRCSRTI
ncbi:MAG: hypothetical protein WA705_12650 [Candidatus Ozemobacteraceae bacterium]